MAATTGVAFIVSSDEAGGSPAAIGGQRNGSVTFTTGSADLGSKDSSVFKEFGRTFSEVEVGFDGVVLESSAGFTGMEADLLAGNLVDFSVALPQTTLTIDGEGILTNLALNAPWEDAYTYSGTIKGTGAVTKA